MWLFRVRPFLCFVGTLDEGMYLFMSHIGCCLGDSVLLTYKREQGCSFRTGNNNTGNNYGNELVPVTTERLDMEVASKAVSVMSNVMLQTRCGSTLPHWLVCENNACKFMKGISVSNILLRWSNSCWEPMSIIRAVPFSQSKSVRRGHQNNALKIDQNSVPDRRKSL